MHGLRILRHSATRCAFQAPLAKAARAKTLKRAFWTQQQLPLFDIGSWSSVKVPKGFEKWFPKGGTPKKKPKETEKKMDEKEAKNKGSERDNEKSSSSKQKRSNNSWGSSNNGSQSSFKGEQPDNTSPQMAGLLGIILFILAMRKLQESEEKSGNEITWNDFRQLLVKGYVEQVVVVNKTMARVHLNADVVASSSSTSGMSSFGSSSMSHDNRVDGRNGSEEWNDATQMEWGKESKTPTLNSSMMSVLTDSEKQRKSENVAHFYFGSVESLEEKLTTAQQELGIKPRNYVPVQYVTETNWILELIKYFPALLVTGLTLWLMKGGMAGANGRGGGGIFQIGKTNAKKITKEDVNVTFADVAGCHEAKKEIMEFVDFLQDSSRFSKLGAKIPKGALLCGPPGTGKTLLAKAVAGEADVPFYSVSGSDFLEMFVGVGPSRVRDLFKEARANSPCIIFIDEIDAVGRQRGRGGFSGGNDERENTLNQLLVEMDGFTSATGVVVLAGTNRADILDQALTRPGRFDRQVVVDKPDLQGRREIFGVHLKGLTLEDEIEDIAGRLAGLTPGFAGADIANICNEAAIVAARRRAEAVALPDFEKATDRIIGGLESNKIMSDEEKSIVAYHEAGHAVAGWFLEHADPLLKVTIIPRTSGALGFAQYLPKEVSLRSQDQIMDIVCMALAGRAAEDVFFGQVTTGASDDLRRVTQMAYSMIHTYGMNSRIGQLAFPQNKDGRPGDKPYSDATAEAMDEEARSIVDNAYQQTIELIQERKSEVDAVAKKLLAQETITHDDVLDLVGPRPFKGDDQYQEYVSARHSRDEEKQAEAAKVAATANQMVAGNQSTPGTSINKTEEMDMETLRVALANCSTFKEVKENNSMDIHNIENGGTNKTNNSRPANKRGPIIGASNKFTGVSMCVVYNDESTPTQQLEHHDIVFPLDTQTTSTPTTLGCNTTSLCDVNATHTQLLHYLFTYYLLRQGVMTNFVKISHEKPGVIDQVITIQKIVTTHDFLMEMNAMKYSSIRTRHINLRFPSF